MNHPKFAFLTTHHYTSTPVGTAGLEPALSCAQGRRISQAFPRPGAQQTVRAAGFEPALSSSPSLRISHAFPRPGRTTNADSSLCGGRTHVSALKGRYPAPLDEQAVLLERAGRRSNPRLLGFNQPLIHLSYRPRSMKKARCFVTPGFEDSTRRIFKSLVSTSQGTERQRIRLLGGEALRLITSAIEFNTQAEHRNLSCHSRPTRSWAGVALVQPVVSSSHP